MFRCLNLLHLTSFILLDFVLHELGGVLDIIRFITESLHSHILSLLYMSVEDGVHVDGNRFGIVFLSSQVFPGVVFPCKTRRLIGHISQEERFNVVDVLRSKVYYNRGSLRRRILPFNHPSCNPLDF